MRSGSHGHALRRLATEAVTSQGKCPDVRRRLLRMRSGPHGHAVRRLATEAVTSQGKCPDVRKIDRLASVGGRVWTCLPR